VDMSSPAARPELARQLFWSMLRIRRFEEKICEVYGVQDMKTPVHLCIGQEAVAAGVCAHLGRADYLFSTHRSHGHCLAKGLDPFRMFAEFYGRAAGCCNGKGGSMHLAAPELGILGTSAIVGGGIPNAVGAALAASLRREPRVCAVFFGDGASEEGVFHESLNFAALRKLPVVFVCENNFYATGSPLSARQPHAEIWRHAAGYGIPGVAADGNDVLAVHDSAAEAVDRARTGQGPTLLHYTTYRWKGHVGPQSDCARGVRPQAELDEWVARCPVAVFRARLLQAGVLDEAECAARQAEIDAELDDALARAKASPFPDTGALHEHVTQQRS
jgi:acetoin:2,6-dichlorophenolindophenol oxidoreductase subunit alpha